MKIRTSTFRMKFAVSMAVATLIAGFAVSTALADSGNKRWRSDGDHRARTGTVGHDVQEVNHRRERGHWRERGDRGDRHRVKPRHRNHWYSDRHFRPAPTQRFYRPSPAQRFHHKRFRHRPQLRHHRHGHGFQGKRFRRYFYFNSYIAPSPIYVVPYHVIDTRPAPASRHQVVAAGDTYCSGGAAPAYASGSRQGAGTIIGGVVGAVVGSQIGKGNGQLAAVGVGTLIGALVGNDIGRSMDAVDRTYATRAVNRALETTPTCTTITWENPQTGNYGTVTPTHTYEPSPGRYCREFQQQVVIGGTLQDAYGTACRQPDGSWEIVAEPS